MTQNKILKVLERIADVLEFKEEMAWSYISDNQREYIKELKREKMKENKK